MIRAPEKAKIERMIKRNLDALDLAISVFRKDGQPQLADGLTDVRDFLASSRAYYQRISTRFETERRTKKEIAQAMWEDITRGRR
jgi:hypothetical protein